MPRGSSLDLPYVRKDGGGEGTVDTHIVVGRTRGFGTVLAPFARRLAKYFPDMFDRSFRHCREEYSPISPFPNLALNIGTEKASRSISILWTAAVVGSLLQLGFFGYATWATWYYETKLKGHASRHGWLLLRPLRSPAHSDGSITNTHCRGAPFLEPVDDGDVANRISSP